MRRTLAARAFLAALLLLLGFQWLSGSTAIGGAVPPAGPSRPKQTFVDRYRPSRPSTPTMAPTPVSRSAALRSTYDPAVPDVRIVVTSRNSYCVESTVDGVTYSKAGPGGDIRPGPCPQKDLLAPEVTSAAANQLRTVVVAMEAYFTRKGTFEGVSVRWLKRMIPDSGPCRSWRPASRTTL
jgi:hypothetical protein